MTLLQHQAQTPDVSMTKYEEKEQYDEEDKHMRLAVHKLKKRLRCGDCF